MKIKVGKGKKSVSHDVVATTETTVEGEVRISCGGSVKLTKKIGDSFVGVEVSNHRSIPVDPKNIETTRKHLRNSVNRDLLDDLNDQVANVMNELKLD